MNSITITDVADMSGVSAKTVSRVINNLPHVNEVTRKRVWTVVDRLGYVPSEAGKQLALRRKNSTKKTGVIGCVVGWSGAKYSGNVFTELLAEIDKELVRRGLRCGFIHTLQELENKALFLKVINPSLIDGCILVGPGSDCRRDIAKIKERVGRVISIGRPIAGNDITSVYGDTYQGAYDGTRHLLDLGHRKIACMKGSKNASGYVNQRFAGFKKALDEVDLFSPELVFYGDNDIDKTERLAVDLLKSPQRPTAIFSISDPMAAGIYKAVYRLGMRIPADLSILSMDDAPLVKYLYPGLTTMRNCRKMLAEAGVSAFCEELSGSRTSPLRMVLPVTMVKRDSCARVNS